MLFQRFPAGIVTAVIFLFVFCAGRAMAADYFLWPMVLT